MIDYALLLAVLISVEGSPTPSSSGDDGRSVGVLMISEAVVEDCNQILKKWGSSFRYTLADRTSPAASRSMAILYLRYWGNQYKRATGSDPTYEVLCRIHNGGPFGYQYAATDAYWKKCQTAFNERE